MLFKRKFSFNCNTIDVIKNNDNLREQINSSVKGFDYIIVLSNLLILFNLDEFGKPPTVKKDDKGCKDYYVATRNFVGVVNEINISKVEYVTIAKEVLSENILNWVKLQQNWFRDKEKETILNLFK